MVLCVESIRYRLAIEIVSSSSSWRLGGLFFSGRYSGLVPDLFLARDLGY
jgi:hypothetical protein